jgi:hypothetical protein
VIRTQGRDCYLTCTSSSSPTVAEKLTLERSGSSCVIVPIKTENWLRFSARLHEGAPPVRFERIF